MWFATLQSIRKVSPSLGGAGGLAGLLAMYSPGTCLTTTSVYLRGPKEGPILGVPMVQLCQVELGRELVKIPFLFPNPGPDISSLLPLTPHPEQ